jgi:lipopolysaccharide assembly protein A
MLQVVVFLALAFSIIIAIFAVQNTTAVEVSFLTFRAQQVAVSILVLVSAALGAGVILLLGAAREVQHRWRHRSLNQQLKAANARVQELEASSTPAEPVPAPTTETEPAITTPITETSPSP